MPWPVPLPGQVEKGSSMAFVGMEDSVATFSGDLSEEEGERINAMMAKLQDEQRAKMLAENPDKPWWPDVVFLARDVKSICQLMIKMDQDQVAHVLAKVVGKSITAALEHLYGDEDDVVPELMEQIQVDADALDDVLKRALEKTFSH